jgi:bile acid-coenzyme A ligase
MVAVSLVAAWAKMAQQNPHKPAVSIGEHPSIAWGDLQSRTNRVARFLQTRGVRLGDLVTIALPTGMKAVEAILATIKVGATPNVISPRLPAPERQQIIELADPRVVIDEDEDRLTNHAVLGHWGDLSVFSDADLPEIISPCLKAPTSGGSTGRPKIILAGWPAVIDDDPKSFIRRLGFPFEGTCLFPGPLYHNAALSGLLAGLGLRCHVVLEERFDPELTLRLIEGHRVDFALFVPTMMNRIWRLPEDVRAKYDLSSLEVVQHNAGACPPDLKRAWIGWLGAHRILENYTATEQTAMTMVSGDEWLERPGTVGKAAFGDIEIRDDQGKPCPPGTVGAVWMRRPEGVPRTFNYKGQDTPEYADGWETVGDLGSMDEDGYLFLADRRADMIISGGTNIYPAEVENVLSGHPGVVECVVVGTPDYDMGELVHAIVSVEDGGPTAAELDKYVRERLAGYKCPRTYAFTALALRDEAGKVRRSQLRQKHIDSKSQLD